MFKKMHQRLICLIGSGMLLGNVALAEAGRWVVVDAQGTKFTPGTLLTAKQKIALAEGERLTLLADDGQTLKLTGPYSGVPGEGTVANNSGGKNLVVISSLLQGHAQPASTLGALRSPGTRKVPPPGAIETSRSGKWCLATDPVVFWREDGRTQESVVLTSADGKPLVTLNWSLGETKLSVPAEHFTDGQTYWIQRSGAPAVQLEVRRAKTPMTNPAAQAAWMAQNGCQAQALGVLRDL